MKCTDQDIEEIENKIRLGDTKVVLQLCDCFMPEIRFATRFLNRMKIDAIRDIINILIYESIKYNIGNK